MICYKCGSHVPDGSKICPTCGNSFEKELKKSDSKAKGLSSGKENIGFGIGDLVAGRYKIKSRIGEGPSGVVFRVLDTEMDVDIALKLMYKSVIEDETDNKRFQAEMRLARKIAHQNIVRVYDIDRDNGYSFYTMQLLEGLTLRKIINLRSEKRQVFSLQEIEPIFIQIYNALASAQNFTYHGNLKPENIMILPDMLKICDFSLVRALGFEKFTELNTANLVYIAPEIKYNWDTVDSRADIYSMAVIIYEMVTGERFRSLPVSASLKNPNVPKSIDNFLNKALSEEQEKRYDSLDEFIEEFKKVVDKEASSFVEEGPEDEEFIEISTDDFELIETQEREKTRKRLPKDRIFFSVEEELKRKKTDEEEEREEIKKEVIEKKSPSKTSMDFEPEEESVPVVKRSKSKDLEEEAKEEIVVKKKQPPSIKEDIKSVPKSEYKVETPRRASIPPPPSKGSDEHKNMLIPMMILVIILAVLGGGVFLLYKAMENQRERDRIMLEQQRMEIEKQRVALEKYQQELMAQLEATKKALSQPKQETTGQKTIEEIKKEEEDKKRLMELEARLSELQKEKENLDKKREEIKVKEKAERKRPRYTEETPKKKDRPQREAEKPSPKIEVVKVEEKREEPKPVEQKVVSEVTKESEPEVKQEEPPPVIQEKKPQCPRGMVLIPEGAFIMGSSTSDPMRGFGEKSSSEVVVKAYCIDIYEYPNRRGAMPKTNVRQAEAESLCQKVGKRLCREDEWEKACKGPGNAKFAYGNTFVSGKCNTADAEGNKGGLQAAGSFAGCVSGYGIFDMSGNAAEITKGATKGGSADKADYASRCAARVVKTSPSPMTGFRCCADPK